MCNIPLEADNIDDSFIETSFEIGKNHVLNTVEYIKICAKKDSWKSSNWNLKT